MKLSILSPSLRPATVKGLGVIHVRIIKASADLLAAPLSNICNVSFCTGSVPDKLKISEVLPIYKSDDKANFTNYRPISIFLYHVIIIIIIIIN